MRTLTLLCTLPIYLIANPHTIHVYESPSTKAKITGAINPKETYSINNNWVHIQSQKINGWVRLNDLKKAHPGSWTYQQSFSSSSNFNKQVEKDVKQSIHEAENIMNSMFHSRDFFSPFQRPIIIINQKGTTKTATQD